MGFAIASLVSSDVTPSSKYPLSGGRPGDEVTSPTQAIQGIASIAPEGANQRTVFSAFLLLLQILCLQTLLFAIIHTFRVIYIQRTCYTRRSGVLGAG